MANAENVLTHVKALAGQVTPRVQAAVLSTLYNRWTTKRRFQQDPTNGCLLRCGGDDSIEHYLRCPTLRTFLSNRLGLPVTQADMWDLLLFRCHPHNWPTAPPIWPRGAEGVYSIYRGTNTPTHHRGPLNADPIHALQQAIYEGTRGHPSSLKLVSTIWARQVKQRV